MTEKQFHRQRRMFWIDMRSDRRLIIAQKNDSRSHADWLEDVFGVKAPQVRGYVDSTGIYIYFTSDCQSNKTVFGIVRPFLSELYCFLNLDPDLMVWNGTIPGALGERWVGAESMGVLSDFLENRS